MTSENAGQVGPPMPETAEGIYTLSAAWINGGNPVAWICQGAKTLEPSGAGSWNESWVYLGGVYREPAQGAAETYQFTYIPAGIPVSQRNGMAANAHAFAQWVAQSANLHNVVLLYDNHQVTRGVLLAP